MVALSATVDASAEDWSDSSPLLSCCPSAVFCCVDATLLLFVGQSRQLFLGHFGQGLFLPCTKHGAFVSAALGDVELVPPLTLAIACGRGSPTVILADVPCIVLFFAPDSPLYRIIPVEFKYYQTIGDIYDSSNAHPTKNVVRVPGAIIGFFLP